MTTIWGVHNDALGQELVDEGFISLGWDDIPDLQTIGNDRERIKQLLQEAYPEAKAGAIPVWAGMLLRFAFTMQRGDLVVAPYRPDSTLNFGVVDGDYTHVGHAPLHQHRRKVRWLRTGVSRGLFPEKALYEIGSALTLFKVQRHADVFRQFLESPSEEQFSEAETVVVDEPEATDAWAAEEPNAARIDRFVRDFVLRSLLKEFTPREFEEFTADLLQATGYQARVTPYSGDGGVDVIAHRDPLGLEPPQIKVQCKQISTTMSRPDVQRLIGTLSTGELGLFVTLGPYSKDALMLERERQSLQLLSGTDVVELVLDHYSRLPQRWRNRVPLRQIYVVDRDAEGR